MSADTSVVIAACRLSGGSELSYTAAVVQAVENLFDEIHGVEEAKGTFIKRPRVWFRGNGAFGRAKQLANLLTEEARANGTLEYPKPVIIEIAQDGVHELSRKGKRKTPPVYMSAPEYGSGGENFDPAVHC